MPLAEIGLASVEWKLDGIRVQAHKSGDEVRLFSRGLNDITAGLPGVVDLVRRVPVKSVVLDGEALGIDEDGQPLIFQDTMSGLATTGAYFFDVLHLDDESLIDHPLRQPTVGVGDVVTRHVAVAVDRHGRCRRGRGIRRQRRCHRPRGCDGKAIESRTKPAGGAQGGARSSRCTPSIWSCSLPSGATGGASAGSATCTSVPAGRRVRDGRQDVQRNDRRAAALADGGAAANRDRHTRATPCTCDRSSSSRSPSTACSVRPAIPAGSRCGSPGCVATARQDRAGGRHDRASAIDARRRSLRVWSRTPWRPCASTSGRWARARAPWRCRSITTWPAGSCTGCC